VSIATARVAAAAAVAIVAALALGSAAGAQEKHRIVGTWVPADRVLPSPLPLTAAARRAIDVARATEAANAAEPSDAKVAGAAEAADAPEVAQAAEASEVAAPRPCAAPGMPAVLDTPAPVEITLQGDKILIRYTEWDATRTVYTNPRSGPPTQQPSAFGVSFGRWEGETLAIFTTYIAHPYFDLAGTPQSAAVSVLERYTPSADGSRLESKVMVTDAATFTAPVVIAGSMAAVGAPAAASGLQDAGATNAAAPDAAAPDAAAPDASAGSAVSSGAAPALVAGRCVG